MILFWILMIFMTVIALGFIVVPLLLKSRQKSTWGIVLFAVLVIQVFSLALYQHLGDRKGYEEWVQTITESADFQNPKSMIIRLQAHLREHPDSAEGWYLLGRLYMSSGVLTQGTAALARAYRLDPKDPKIMAQYALALFTTQQYSLTGKADAIVKNLLQKDPNNTDALNLLALDAYQKSQYSAAIQFWQKMQRILPQGSEEAKSVEAAIQKAKQNLMPTHGFHFQIEVALDESLKSKLQTQDTLFVYAKAVGGSPMPIAVRRFNSTTFPMSVQLTEKNLMDPNQKLSGLDRLQFFARISRSGSAMPSAGDMQGESGPLKMTDNAKAIKISINRIL